MCASQPHGNNHVFLFSKETAKGTPVSPAKDLGLRQNVPLSNAQQSRQLHTTGQAGAVKIRGGKGDLSGSMELLFQHGRILELITGGTVVHLQEASTSDWTHTFPIGDDLPSFTLEDSFELGGTDVANTYEGCMLKSLTASLALDGELGIRADLTAMDVVTGTSATTDVISTTDTLADFEGSFSVGVLDSEVALAQVQSFDLTLARNSKKQWGLGSRIPSTVQAGQLDIDFSATLAYIDNTETARILGGTSISASDPTGFGVILEANNGVAIGSGRKEFHCQLQETQYSTDGHATPMGDYVLQDIKGTGKLHTLFNVDTLTSATF